MSSFRSLKPSLISGGRSQTAVRPAHGVLPDLRSTVRRPWPAVVLGAFATLCLLLPSTADAQWRSVGNVDSVTATHPGELMLRSGEARVAIRVLEHDIVQIRFAPGGTFDPGRSRAVIRPPELAPDAQMTPSPGTLTMATSRIRVIVNRRPLRISVQDSTGRVITNDDPDRGMAWSGTEVRVWKGRPPGERYYGFGEKAGSLERSDMAMTMWNSDIPGYAADTDPLYETIPFFYGITGSRAYAIFLDNSWRSSFDMGKEARDAYAFGAEAGDLNYYIFTGPDPKAILSQFTEMAGRMPLPPLWSLGYQQCRWSYAPEARVREIAAGFRDRKIPCDVIYLDIDYMDGYRIFTWSPKNFPDPKGMISDLGRQGFHVAVIVDPGIKADSSYHAFRSGLAADCFLRYGDGTLYTGKVWPGVCAFPDFSFEKGRRWWGDQFKVLLDAGVRGWWNDMNEPSVFDVPTKTIDVNVIHNDDGLRSSHLKNHNVYGMEMTQATYEGVKRLLPDERPFVLTRASFAGGWRYSAAWTGDNVASWEHLALAASMCLNLSMSGQPFVGADIGGFIGYPSGELFARWLELGVFTPLMRAHSVINEKNKEPWQYGDSCTAINRGTIELRYRMLPYIYTVMEQASRTGIPAMRPIVLEFPADERFHDRADEFMFGDGLLVAPVLAPGVREREVLLPAGGWYDFWADTALHAGGKAVTAAAPLARLPLFVREGTILPTRQVVQSTGEAPIDPLTLSVYPGMEGKEYAGEYYEDDGRSFGYTTGVYLRRGLTQRRAEGTTTVRLAACDGSFRPPARNLAIQLKSVRGRPSTVTVNGTKLRPGEQVNQWVYDAPRKSVRLLLADARGVITIVLKD